jgi:hypothetical protein
VQGDADAQAFGLVGISQRCQQAGKQADQQQAQKAMTLR